MERSQQKRYDRSETSISSLLPPSSMAKRSVCSESDGRADHGRGGADPYAHGIHLERNRMNPIGYLLYDLRVSSKLLSMKLTTKTFFVKETVIDYAFTDVSQE